MNNITKLIILCSLSLMLCTSLPAQTEDTYLWPTDASRYLTSAFGEYRARRFHTGIDVRTWGKTGYKCYAVRSGYVWRISVSPYGYGRAIYLKLDTGEIAVYAHLLKFNDAIQPYVEAEQKRTGKYRVNVFLKPHILPVQKGDVIAWTGQTGIGAPHLHFEIRDSANRPTNPLLKGYEIPDNVSPVVRKVSFSPLDPSSEVNGDFQPLVLTPQWVRAGEYYAPETISVWGNVGIAVSSYDKSYGSSSRYGVYSLALYVDDILRFSYRYDRLNFQNNPMVELERDYRLDRRDLGRFYKLYKDEYNANDIYSPNRTWAGVIRSASLTPATSIGNQDGKSENASGALFPGVHEFRIEVADFQRNTSTVSGKFNVGATFEMRPVVKLVDGALTLADVVTYDLNRVEELSTFVYRGRRWEQLDFDWDSGATSTEKGGEGTEDEPVTRMSGVFLPVPASGTPTILRFEGRDQFGARSRPSYYVHADMSGNSIVPQLDVRYDFYDDYLRIEIESNNILSGVPQATLYPGRWDAREIPVYQRALKSYVGRVELKYLNGTEHPVQLRVKNLAGEQFDINEQFLAEQVRPATSDRVYSSDQKFWVNFWSNSLFEPIYTRIRIDSSSTIPGLAKVGAIYHVEPMDVLLKKGAFVHLSYPGDTENPDKLGVYYRTSVGRWIFIDNEHDAGSHSISAKVLSFEQFALIRDEDAPEISRIQPAHHARIRNSLPLISANIRDDLSGIDNEMDLEIRLDGRKLICEYDPERDRLFYQVDQPLAKGRHDLIVMAIDKSRNVAVKETSFWVD